MKKTTKSLISLLTAGCFFVTQFGPMAPALAAEVKTFSNLSLNIPPELGTLQNVTLGQGPLVLHIQTAHGNYEAQKKIEALLHYLKKTYGVKLLLLEGSASQLNPELLKLFPERMDLTRKIAEELTREALVKGDELFLLDESQVEAYGIENVEAYRTNREAFQAVLTERKKSQNFIEEMDRQIDYLVGPYLNKDLRAFLRRLEDYETKRVPILDWLSALKTQAKEYLEMDLLDPVYQIDWPALIRIYKLGEFEKKIDLKAFEKERNQFLKAISGIASVASLPRNDFEQIQSLLSSPLSRHQLPDPDTRMLFERMAAALPPNFNYEAYPNIEYFIGHLILQSEIKGERLAEEIARLEDKIAEKLASTPEEKKILSLLKDHRLLKRLFALEFTPEDHENLLSRVEAVRPGKVIERFLEVGRSKRTRGVKFQHVPEIEILFDRALDFYQGVKDRDRWLTENVTARMKALNADKAVVITGGFHAGPFRQFFGNQGYSYALISPRIAEAGSREDYIESVLQSTMETPRRMDPHAALLGEDLGWVARRMSVPMARILGGANAIPIEGPAVRVKLNGTGGVTLTFKGGLLVPQDLEITAGRTPVVSPPRAEVRRIREVREDRKIILSGDQTISGDAVFGIGQTEASRGQISRPREPLNTQSRWGAFQLSSPLVRASEMASVMRYRVLPDTKKDNLKPSGRSQDPTTSPARKTVPAFTRKDRNTLRLVKSYFSPRRAEVRMLVLSRRPKSNEDSIIIGAEAEVVVRLKWFSADHSAIEVTGNAKIVPGGQTREIPRREGKAAAPFFTMGIKDTLSINDNIKITVVEIDRGKVRIGVEAPREIPVRRIEIFEKIIKERREAGPKVEAPQPPASFKEFPLVISPASQRIEIGDNQQAVIAVEYLSAEGVELLVWAERGISVTQKGLERSKYTKVNVMGRPSADLKRQPFSKWWNKGETLVLNDEIELTPVEISAQSLKFLVRAPEGIPVRARSSSRQVIDYGEIAGPKLIYEGDASSRAEVRIDFINLFTKPLTKIAEGRGATLEEMQMLRETLLADPVQTAIFGNLAEQTAGEIVLERLEILQKAWPEFSKWWKSYLPGVPIPVDTLWRFYIPFSQWIVVQKRAKDRRAGKNVPYKVYIYGSQGRGKTVTSRALVPVLNALLELEEEGRSGTRAIDDFYLGHMAREALKTLGYDPGLPGVSNRGIPGTHDTDWIKRGLKEVEESHAKSVIKMGNFLKRIDDNPREHFFLTPLFRFLNWLFQLKWLQRLRSWRPVKSLLSRLERYAGPFILKGKIGVFILDGWMYPDLDFDMSKVPPGLKKTVAQALLDHYQFFKDFDAVLAFETPNIDEIIANREQQEQLMERREGKRGMSPQAVIRFVQYFNVDGWEWDWKERKWTVTSPIPSNKNVTFHVGIDANRRVTTIKRGGRPFIPTPRAEVRRIREVREDRKIRLSEGQTERRGGSISGLVSGVGGSQDIKASAQWLIRPPFQQIRSWLASFSRGVDQNPKYHKSYPEYRDADAPGQGQLLEKVTGKPYREGRLPQIGNISGDKLLTRLVKSNHTPENLLGTSPALFSFYVIYNSLFVKSYSSSRAEVRKKEKVRERQFKNGDRGVFVGTSRREGFLRLSERLSMPLQFPRSSDHPPFLMEKPMRKATAPTAITAILTWTENKVKKLLAYAAAKVIEKTFSIARSMKSLLASVKNSLSDSIREVSLSEILSFVNTYLPEDYIKKSSPRAEVRADSKRIRLLNERERLDGKLRDIFNNAYHKDNKTVYEEAQRLLRQLGSRQFSRADLETAKRFIRKNKEFLTPFREVLAELLRGMWEGAGEAAIYLLRKFAGAFAGLLVWTVGGIIHAVFRLIVMIPARKITTNNLAREVRSKVKKILRSRRGNANIRIFLNSELEDQLVAKTRYQNGKYAAGENDPIGKLMAAAMSLTDPTGGKLPFEVQIKNGTDIHATSRAEVRAEAGHDELAATINRLAQEYISGSPARKNINVTAWSDRDGFKAYTLVTKSQDGSVRRIDGAEDLGLAVVEHLDLYYRDPQARYRVERIGFEIRIYKIKTQAQIEEVEAREKDQTEFVQTGARAEVRADKKAVTPHFAKNVSALTYNLGSGYQLSINLDTGQSDTVEAQIRYFHSGVLLGGESSDPTIVRKDDILKNGNESMQVKILTIDKAKRLVRFEIVSDAEVQTTGKIEDLPRAEVRHQSIGVQVRTVAETKTARPELDVRPSGFSKPIALSLSRGTQNLAQPENRVNKEEFVDYEKELEQVFTAAVQIVTKYFTRGIIPMRLGERFGPRALAEFLTAVNFLGKPVYAAIDGLIPEAPTSILGEGRVKMADNFLNKQTPDLGFVLLDQKWLDKFLKDKDPQELFLLLNSFRDLKRQAGIKEPLIAVVGNKKDTLNLIRNRLAQLLKGESTLDIADKIVLTQGVLPEVESLVRVIEPGEGQTPEQAINNFIQTNQFGVATLLSELIQITGDANFFLDPDKVHSSDIPAVVFALLALRKAAQLLYGVEDQAMRRRLLLEQIPNIMPGARPEIQRGISFFAIQLAEFVQHLKSEQALEISA